MDVLFTTNKKEAELAIAQGYTAVECSFGNKTLANDKKEPFDHHNQYSSLPSATLQALKSSKITKGVVVNHIDFDSVMAAALLLGKVNRGNTNIKDLVTLIDITDREGLKALTKIQRSSPAGKMILYFYAHTESLAPSKANFMKALGLAKSFEGGLTPEMEAAADKFDRGRAEEAERGIVRQKGDVLLVHSDMIGFDFWYKKAPVVVLYNGTRKTISIGVINIEKSEELFGPRGLKNVFPKLGPEWGGRENIGGSPRGKEMTFSDAEEIFEKIVDMLNKKKVASSSDWVGIYLESR
jgi:hypothetical protein